MSQPTPQQPSDAPAAHRDESAPRAAAIREPDPQRINELLTAINDGRIDPAGLGTRTRRVCVGHLLEQGFSNDEIADLFSVSARTVRRDRVTLRRKFALRRSDGLGGELLGEFERTVQAANQRLVRLGRDASAPPYVRLWAEEAITRNYKRFLDTAVKMQHITYPCQEHDHVEDAIRQIEGMMQDVNEDLANPRQRQDDNARPKPDAAPPTTHAADKDSHPWPNHNDSPSSSTPRTPTQARQHTTRFRQS